MSEPRRRLPGFGGVVASWALVMLVVRTLQHLSFGTNAFDLSVFDTMLWSTTHGSLMATPLYGTWASHLALHFTPLLFLLVPLYWVFDGPMVLLYAQVAVGAALGIVVYRAALQRLHDRRAAWMLGLAALVYKPWLDALMYDFHPELLFPVALVMAYVATTGLRGALVYWVAIGVGLTIKEDMALYLIGFGLLLAWLRPVDRRRGLATALVSAAWFLLVLGVVVPWIRMRSGLPDDYVYASLWNHLGDSLPQVVWRAITDPGAVLGALDLRRTLGALASMLGPLLLLPLGSRWFLGAAIPLGVLATSSSPVMQGLGLHYAAPLIGFAWIATIETLGRIASRWPAPDRGASPGREARGFAGSARRAGVLTCVAAVVLLATVASTRWGIVRPRSYEGLAERRAVLAVLAELPDDASVAAQSSLLPHVAKRWGLQMLPTLGDATEYVLLDTALNPWPLTAPELEQLRDRLLQDEFEVAVEQSHAVLLRRR